MKNKDIENIIIKSFTETLTCDDQKILDDWISKSLENKRKYETRKKFWKRSDNIAPEPIDVETALIKTKKRIKEFRFKRTKKFFIPAAAILVILISITFLLNEYINSSHITSHLEKITFQEIRAAYGTKTKLLLADSTVVWLNSGSTLKFPTSFNGLDERRVYLNGEGFFDVTKNNNKPFIVNTSGVNVKVYGTSFNVSAYEDYDSMVVALVEGKVSLVNESNDIQNELMILEPFDVVECNFESKKMNHIPHAEMEKYTAWKDGYMIFYGDPIESVIRRLEKWYNVDIEIRDKTIEEYRFTATFKDESLEQILNLLGMSSPIDYEIIPSRKLNDNTFSVRKVILTKN